jgi:dolichol-phosphate mannosyltransferase
VVQNTELPPLFGGLIPELSVVMPALDEEQALPVALSEATESLNAICKQWEILVVDDGSTDDTPEVLREHAQRDGRIRVLRQHGHQGYGTALRRGFDAARYLVVCTVDADAQYDISDVALLYPLLKDVDMVAGYRETRADGGVRRLAAGASNRLQTLLLGIRARDPSCSLRLYRRSFLYMIELDSTDFLIRAELMARAVLAGLRWTEAGVSHRPRRYGHSKAGSGLPSLSGLLRLRKRLSG